MVDQVDLGGAYVLSDNVALLDERFHIFLKCRQLKKECVFQIINGEGTVLLLEVLKEGLRILLNEGLLDLLVLRHSLFRWSGRFLLIFRLLPLFFLFFFLILFLFLVTLLLVDLCRECGFRVLGGFGLLLLFATPALSFFYRYFFRHYKLKLTIILHVEAAN